MLLGMLLTAVDWASFSRPFYANSYRALNTAEHIAISQEDLDAATEQLLDYIQAKTPALDIEVTLILTGEAEKVKMFNQREVDHMVDVRDLYLLAMLVRNVLFFVAAVCVFALLLIFRKNRTKEDFKSLKQGLLLALLVFLGILLAIGAYAALDFNAFWTRFHLLFFSNDLWILNPLTDRLIMMVPSPFFSALVKKIILTALLALIVYNVLAFSLSFLLEKYSFKRTNKEREMVN